MAESYSRIQSRIVQLQRQAESLRRSEVAGVIKKIKVAIEAYGLQPDDLFGAGNGSGVRASSSESARPRSRRQSSAAAEGTRYADGQGNTWGGRGPRPKWLRDALDGGQSLESFVADKPARAPAPAAKKRAAGKGIAIKYRDGDNTWTGRGSQPRWLRAALGEGKTLEQFQV